MANQLMLAIAATQQSFPLVVDQPRYEFSELIPDTSFIRPNFKYTLESPFILLAYHDDSN